jgi:ribosomal protein S3
LTLTKISFWKHRLFLRYLQYVFLILAQYYLPTLAIKGIRLVVKGKISSAGNARKRKFYISVGSTSFSTLTNKIIYHYKQVSTFTGALGLKF